MVKEYGITRERVLEYSAQFAVALHEAVLKQAGSSDKLYVPIPEAVTLAQRLFENHFFIGLLTGNVERMARWKLDHAGVPDIFVFGLFGDDVDDRVTLAKTVFEKAKNHFGITFLPKDIVVVGDAIGDIRCAKAIGATTIIAMTGGLDSILADQFPVKDCWAGILPVLQQGPGMLNIFQDFLNIFIIRIAKQNS